MKQGDGKRINKPNIVFILIDDMGWRDLVSYGSTFYETPNIDRLAEEGIRFTDAYAACPVCSPTRASIMTGKYPATMGVTDYIGAHSSGKLLQVPYIDHLPLEEKSMAVALKERGYHTWHVGKWHLGSKDYYPDCHGFDVNIGGCHLATPWDGYFSPYNIETLDDGEKGECLTDRLTDEAIALIEAHTSGSDEPFFLNLWHYAVHTPIQAKEEDIRHFRQKAKHLRIDDIEPFIEGDYYPCDHKKDIRIKRRIIQSDPVYAAMIYNLDMNMGRLIQSLKDRGIYNDTMIVFTSDNGGLATAGVAPTNNAPLHEGKGWMYEGGVRVPLIISWPGNAPAGTVCHGPVTSTDYYPTFMELIGEGMEAQQHTDGVSFLSKILEPSKIQEEERPIYWHYPHYGNQGCTPGSSVRIGDYKLIEFFEDGRLELYNLGDDVSEVYNLVDKRPKLVVAMHELLRTWREGINAIIPKKA